MGFISMIIVQLICSKYVHSVYTSYVYDMTSTHHITYQ